MPLPVFNETEFDSNSKDPVNINTYLIIGVFCLVLAMAFMMLFCLKKIIIILKTSCDTKHDNDVHTDTTFVPEQELPMIVDDEREELTDEEVRTGPGEDNSTFIPSNPVIFSQLDEDQTSQSETETLPEAEDFAAGASISRKVCHQLCEELENKLHDFIYMLEDPSSNFDSRKEMIRLRNENKDFLSCGRKALWQWVCYNSTFNLKILIQEALFSVGEPDLLTLTENKIDSRKASSTSLGLSSNESLYMMGSLEPYHLLYRLFYRITHMLDDECLHSFLLQLPKVSECDFNVMSVLEEAKRNNSSYDNDVMFYIETIIQWRKKNGILDLRDSLVSTLSGLDRKDVLEDPMFVKLLDQMSQI